jgi:hypothetical protein
MLQEVTGVHQGKLAAGRGIGYRRGEAATPPSRGANPAGHAGSPVTGGAAKPADDTKKILLDESDPTKFVIIGTGLSAK